MAGFARGMDGTRALRPPGGPPHPRRRREGTPIPGGGRWLPIDYSWQGGRVLPWSPTAGRGSRDRETRGPRVEAGTVGPRAWSPCCGRRTSGSLQRHGLRGPRLPEAAARDAAACGRRGWAEVPPAEWAERPGLGLLPGAASRRRAAVGLSRGPSSTSRSRGGGQGWAASGCARGAPRPGVTQPRPPPGAGTRPGPAVGS